MTLEKRVLLFRDLCARLPYGVKIQVFRTSMEIDTLSDEVLSYLSKDGYLMEVEGEILPHIMPYLRPMSSITSEEMAELDSLGYKRFTFSFSRHFNSITLAKFDWLNEHHFDYRRLIDKGLALEAPIGMYNFNLSQEK